MSAAVEPASAILSVHLGGVVLGLPATAVREIVRAVAIAPLPAGPTILEGVVNLRGALVPVIDVRRRLGMAPRTLDADEFLVILESGGRTLAMRVDEVDDLVAMQPRQARSPAELSPALVHLAGLGALPDGTVVIYDPAAFVTQAETEAIDAAVAAA